MIRILFAALLLLAPAAFADPLQFTPVYSDSGVTTVSGTFAATGQSSSFRPIAGRPFWVELTGTWVGTVDVESSRDGGSTWLKQYALGTQIYTYTSNTNEQLIETRTGMLYRLNCTAYTSGTVTYALTQ